MTRQVHQVNGQEIQNRRLQIHPYSDGNMLQIEHRQLI